MNNQKLWTKDFIIAATINFLLTMVFYLLIVIMAVYVTSEYNASTSMAGLVTGIFIIGGLFGGLLTGRNIESVGLRKTLFVGLVLLIITTALYFVSGSITALLIIRFAQGYTLGIAGTAAGTIVARLIPETRRGEGIGYFSMSTTLAAAFGPFIGLYLVQNASYNVIFGFCLLLSVFSLITAFFMKIPISEYEVEEIGYKVSDFMELRTMPIVIIVLFLALCYSGVLTYINIYAEEKDLVEVASFFFIVYSIAILGSRPFTGRLMDRKGANFIMYPAFVIFTVGLILLSMANSGVVLLISAFLIGLGFGNMQSCSQAVAIKLTPPHRFGLATSTYFIFLDAGLGFGPYVLGFIIPLTGYSTMYAILGFVVIFAAALYFLLYGRREKILMENSF